MESFFTEEKTSHQQSEQGPYEKLLTNYFSTLETNKTEAICKYLLEILKLSAS